MTDPYRPRRARYELERITTADSSLAPRVRAALSQLKALELQHDQLRNALEECAAAATTAREALLGLAEIGPAKLEEVRVAFAALARGARAQLNAAPQASP